MLCPHRGRRTSLEWYPSRPSHAQHAVAPTKAGPAKVTGPWPHSVGTPQQARTPHLKAIAIATPTITASLSFILPRCTLAIVPSGFRRDAPSLQKSAGLGCLIVAYRAARRFLTLFRWTFCTSKVITGFTISAGSQNIKQRARLDSSKV